MGSARTATCSPMPLPSCACWSKASVSRSCAGSRRRARQRRIADAALWSRAPCRAVPGPPAGRSGRIAPGFRADLVVLDPDHPSLFGRRWRPRARFAPVRAGHAPVRDVMVGGNWSAAWRPPCGGGYHRTRLPTRDGAPSGLAAEALPCRGRRVARARRWRAAGSERAPAASTRCGSWVVGCTLGSPSQQHRQALQSSPVSRASTAARAASACAIGRPKFSAKPW